MSGIVRTILVVGAIALGSSAKGQEVLTVQNDMQDAVYVWLKSEGLPRKKWRNFLIGKGRQLQITLRSPDRFELAVTDLTDGQYYADLLPLRQMIRDDPGFVLSLSGVFQTDVKQQLYWSPELGYFYETIDSPDRVAVVFHLKNSNGDGRAIVVPRTPLKPQSR